MSFRRCSRTIETNAVLVAFPHHQDGAQAAFPHRSSLWREAFGLKLSPAPCSKRRRRRSEHKEHVTKSTFVSIDRSFLALFSVFTLQLVVGKGGGAFPKRFSISGLRHGSAIFAGRGKLERISRLSRKLHPGQLARVEMKSYKWGLLFSVGAMRWDCSRGRRPGPRGALSRRRAAHPDPNGRCGGHHGLPSRSRHGRFDGPGSEAGLPGWS